MWRLLARNLARIAAVADDPAAKARAMAGVQSELVHARQVLEEIARIMAEMAHLGKQDTPEYRRVFAAYQGLSHLVAETARGLKDEANVQAGVQRGTGRLAAGEALQGLNPIKGTLGPAGRGAVFRGPEVTNLQKFLTAMGFPVQATGEYDSRTRMAVQQFQGRYALPADGMVGAATRKVINGMVRGE